jgi:Peptidase A4 family
MFRSGQRGLVAPRRSLALIIAIMLSCLATGCGGSGGVVIVPSTSTFSRAGYQALHAYLRFAVSLSRETGNSGLPPARIERLRPLCRHLGPNVVDLEVQGVRAWCAGGLAQALALHELRACVTVRNAQRRCDVVAFRRFANATTAVVSAENGILQILGTGPCYTMVDAGVPQNQRLLTVTEQLETTLDGGYATHRLLDSWQHALDVSFVTAPNLSSQVRHSTACRPGSRATAALAHPKGAPQPGTSKAHRPTGAHNNGCACVGYLWHGHVTSVSATWTVPALATKSPNGIAATWIGAESEGRFIQIGVNEGRYVPGTDADLHFVVGQNQPLMYAFWSDTDHHFHPVPLPRVKPGDVVHASLMLVNGRWQLRFSDPQASVNVSLTTHDEAGAMDDAEWLQEDVAVSAGSQRLLPYPEVSPVTFEDLTANGATPIPSQLIYRRRPVRSKETLVAGPVRNGAFTVFKTTLPRARAQYIAKADRVCRAADGKIEAAQDAIDHPDISSRLGRTRIARELTTMNTLGDASLAQLRAIPKPAASVAVLTKIWNELARMFRLDAELVPAVKNDDKGRLTRTATETAAADAKYESLAQRYGFDVCGQG